MVAWALRNGKYCVELCCLTGVRLQEVVELPYQPIVSLGFQDDIVFTGIVIFSWLVIFLNVACMRILIELSFQTN